MILKASQRGSAKALAVHLLNTEDNDHVEVHSVQGFLSTDVTSAFKEVQAIAKGTKCSKPFFAVSLSPPSDVSVSIEVFEDAILKIEEVNGLTDQPHVIIFHEKDGRRHAHAVWSRIEPETMTAKNLPFFKNKLQDISRQIYLDQQWKMPPGLMDRSNSNPTNVTLAEWQAAKRRGKNAIDQKRLIQQCWAISDSRAGFESALGEHGYILARGNRRSHVIVCHDGEVIAVARAIKQKTKIVRERLGQSNELPTVQDALNHHQNNLQQQFSRLAGEVRSDLAKKRKQLNEKRHAMIARHRAERAMIDKGQSARWQKETRQRAARLKSGIAGVWQWMNGERRRLHMLNEREALKALSRDRNQRQTLINAQLKDRRELEQQRIHLRQQSFGLVKDLKSDRDAIVEKLNQPANQRPLSPRRLKRPDQEIIPDESFDLEL